MKNPFQNWLLGIFEDLFKGKPISVFHDLFPVAYELVHCAVADGWLTKEEVIEVENAYAAKVA